MKTRQTRPRRRHRGQAMTEYLVAALVVIMLVAIPISGGDSALALLLDSLRVAFARLSSFLSLPG